MFVQAYGTYGTANCLFGAKYFMLRLLYDTKGLVRLIVVSSYVFYLGATFISVLCVLCVSLLYSVL